MRMSPVLRRSQEAARRPSGRTITGRRAESLSRLPVVVIAALVVLGVADSAMAWGPAMHIGLADTVLGNLGLLPAAVAVVLRGHRTAYRYGSIAADVVFAKRLSRIKQFCHHWSTGFRLLERAETEQGQAFAYGYLSHLAADTVAHGKYVPRQVLLSGSTLNLGHLYWELRADATQAEPTWDRLTRLLRANHDEHDGALRGHLRETFLPHDWNLLLFYRMNAAATRPAVRKALAAWGRSWGSELPADLLGEYQSESIERIQSILKEGARSAVVHDDPNGTSALMRVSVHRRDARRRRRRGLNDGRGLEEAERAFGPMVAAGSPGG